MRSAQQGDEESAASDAICAACRRALHRDSVLRADAPASVSF